MNFGENFSLNINDKRYCRLKKKDRRGKGLPTKVAKFWNFVYQEKVISADRAGKD